MHRVLVVDDEPLVRASLRSLRDWNEDGFDLSAEARNGLEALDRVARGGVDIVLLDMAMPRCDGIGFLKGLKDLEYRPAVVVVSAFDEFSLVREAFTLGAVDYLLKADITAGRVRAVLDRAVEELEDRRDAASGDRPLLDDRLTQQLLRDLVHSADPREFLPLLHSLGMNLAFPCLPVEYRLVRANDTVSQFLRSGLESRNAEGQFLGLTETDFIWLLSPRRGLGLSPAEQAEALSRELAEITRQTLNAAFEWAIGEEAAVLEDLPPAVKGLSRLFRNASRPVHRAKAYIRREYRNPSLNLAATAEHAGVSRTHLSALFAKELGMGFSDYLIRVRIDAAKRLLGESAMKVYEVAEAVGYGSVEQFSRTFKRITGTTANRFQADSGGHRP